MAPRVGPPFSATTLDDPVGLAEDLGPAHAAHAVFGGLDLVAGVAAACSVSPTEAISGWVYMTEGMAR